MQIKEGDFFELSNGDFCAVMEIFLKESYNPDYVKFRVVKSCKGKYSEKKRIGKPYTYQLISQLPNFKKRIKRQISKEEILKLLFKQHNHITLKPFPLKNVEIDNISLSKNPKITLFKFKAEETKQADITRFRNLLKKLRVEIDIIENSTKLKGQRANVVVIDEVDNLKDVKGIWKKLKEMGIWKNK